MSTWITVAGNLAADPELRFTAQGKAVVKITVMSSRSVKDADGKWHDEDVTGWPVTCWDKLAENVAESCAKGDGVIITGYAATRSWESQSGEKRQRVEITGRDVALSLRRGSARSNRQERSAAPRPAADPWMSPPDTGEEVPF
jgi:single-strand DNA-binding protein